MSCWSPPTPQAVREALKSPRPLAPPHPPNLSLLPPLTSPCSSRPRFGAPGEPSPKVARADMEAILDSCLKTAGYLALSRDHRKVSASRSVLFSSSFSFSFSFFPRERIAGCSRGSCGRGDKGKRVRLEVAPSPGLPDMSTRPRCSTPASRVGEAGAGAAESSRTEVPSSNGRSPFASKGWGACLPSAPPERYVPPICARRRPVLLEQRRDPDRMKPRRVGRESQGGTSGSRRQ